MRREPCDRQFFRLSDFIAISRPAAEDIADSAERLDEILELYR